MAETESLLTRRPDTALEQFRDEASVHVGVRQPQLESIIRGGTTSDIFGEILFLTFIFPRIQHLAQIAAFIINVRVHSNGRLEFEFRYSGAWLIRMYLRHSIESAAARLRDSERAADWEGHQTECTPSDSGTPLRLSAINPLVLEEQPPVKVQDPRAASEATAQAHFASLASTSGGASSSSAAKKAPKPPKDYKAELQKTQRKLRHAKEREKKLQAALEQLKARGVERRLAVAVTTRQTAELCATVERLLAAGHKSTTEGKLANDLLRKKNKALQQRVKRTAGIISRSIARAKGRTCRVTEKGIYTAQARKLARIMADSVTISADSTSNRGQNIESAHLATRTPNYKTKTLEIDPQFDAKSPLFSPLARRLERRYSMREFFKILKGMLGDHASVEKGTAKGSYMDLVHYLAAWNAKKIADAGGEEAWDALSPAEQTKLDAKLMHEIVTVLGKEEYDALSPENRRTTAAMQKEKALAKIRKDAEVLRQNLQRRLVPLEEMSSLTVAGIVLQINAYQARGVPNILKISKYRLKADKLAALTEASGWYELHGTQIALPEASADVPELVPEVIDDWAAEEDAEKDE
ncbi:hypothetical protein DFH09DRAFT_1072450 [Mycena vulgaris]|nr:hypothetical protein DFH09DRAFT_1072450 [Mycena vulgaris]